MNDRTYVPEALEALDPAGMTYQQWAEVGMALHAEGYGVNTWEEWSRRDPARFHPGECARKWASFGNSPSKVTGGTIVQMARERGWTRPRRPWDGPDEDRVYDDYEPYIVDPGYVEPAELPRDADGWDPVRELVRYLDAVFTSEDIVGVVTRSFKGDDGRWRPSGLGTYQMTASEIASKLREKRDVGAVLGDADPEAGAWIRFNPLNGKGVRNADVAEFRHALVESDEVPKEEQLALVRALELPCSAIVDSGGKSMHAIVRVDAADLSEYRKRIDYLYKVCERHGLKVDQQNKNPSRLSRCPGFMRAGNPQRLVSGPCGKASWDEWVEWVEERTDDLPEFENLACVLDDMPELSPELIHGVLRRGHKMFLAAGSKTGKTFAMIELAIAIAEGREWLGFRCEQGRVLYLNMELDRASFFHRIRDTYSALGIEPAHAANIDVWNLRGKSMPMDRLVPSLIRRALKTRPAAIILDPVYKVNMGDENSAEQVARFCNQLDMVAEKVGASMAYVHHHSKGAQGGKASIDRASGSGVFARDADAQVDMVSLPLDDDVMKAVEDRMVGDACEGYLAANAPEWQTLVDDDCALAGGNAMVSECRKLLDPLHLSDGMLEAVSAARDAASRVTGLRVDVTVRDFEDVKPVNVWFEPPLHRIDETGILADIKPDGADEDRRRKGPSPTDLWHREAITATGMVIAGLLANDEKPTKKAVASGLGVMRAWSTSRANNLKPLAVTEDNLDKWVKSDWYPFEYVDNGVDENGGTRAKTLRDTRPPESIREYKPYQPAKDADEG